VDLHSLRVAGGMVLFWVGFNALRKGVFFEQDTHARFADIAVVPLACPMIAGPATITACITLTAQHGYVFPISAMLIAIGVNTALMLFAKRIGELLKRFDILGALIRLTGLVVMTMGVQMIFDGLEQWVIRMRG
jgi:multiple antibiotic resistance protein